MHTSIMNSVQCSYYHTCVSTNIDILMCVYIYIMYILIYSLGYYSTKKKAMKRQIL